MTSGVVTNAASSKVYGGELEGSFRVTPQFRLDGSVAYLKTSFTAFPKAYDAVFGATVDLTGNELPRAPAWTINLAAQYKVPVGAGNVTARADFQYMSHIYFTQFNETPFLVAGVLRNPYARAQQPGFTHTNARLRYNAPNDRYFIEAYVENIENKAVLEYATVTAVAALGGYAPPRTFGGRVGFKF